MDVLYQSWKVSLIFLKYLWKLSSIGSVSNVRSLIKRACEYSKNNVIAAYNYSVEFERKFGDLEDLEKAELKMKEKMEQSSQMQPEEVELPKIEKINDNQDQNLKKRKFEELLGTDSDKIDPNEPQILKKFKTEDTVKSKTEDNIKSKVVYSDNR